MQLASTSIGWRKSIIWSWRLRKVIGQCAAFKDCQKTGSIGYLFESYDHPESPHITSVHVGCRVFLRVDLIEPKIQMKGRTRQIPSLTNPALGTRRSVQRILLSQLFDIFIGGGLLLFQNNIDIVE